MYRKLKLILLTIILTMILVGCQQTQTQTKSNDKTTISYEKLSDKEERILNVTGNKVLMYNIKNLPKDKNYKLELIYEAYKDGKKEKEDIIASVYSDDERPKINSEVLTINYQEDKIRYVVDENGGCSSGTYEIEKKLDQRMMQAYLSNEVNLKLGTEMYIYQASKGEKIGDDSYSYDNVELGTPIHKANIERMIKDSEGEVFVKLVYKEIK